VTALTLDIGGVIFAIQISALDWLPVLAARYAAFATGCNSVAWTVELRYDPDLTDPNPPWLRHADELTTYHVPGCLGRLELDLSRAIITTPSLARAPGALERSLAYICMQALPRAGAGLLLHGVGVCLDGCGFAFVGASGAGKTTVAKLATNYGELLCDENLIVCLEPSGPLLCSTPFWGMSTPPELIQRVNRRLPLRALFVLEHAADFALIPLRAGAAVIELLTTEKVATERVASASAWLSAAERLIAQTPIYRLAFRPTVELWPFLHAALPGAFV
jgi:hypothetical protein